MIEVQDQKELFQNALRYSNYLSLHNVHDEKHLFEMVNLLDHYNSVYYWSTPRTVFYTAKWIYEHPKTPASQSAPA